jgi:hypothetical protein
MSSINMAQRTGDNTATFTDAKVDTIKKIQRMRDYDLFIYHGNATKNIVISVAYLAFEEYGFENFPSPAFLSPPSPSLFFRLH